MIDTDDELHPVGGQPDLSEYIDNDSLDRVQHEMEKREKDKAKRDKAKAPTKNDIRVEKNQASKKSYYSMTKETRDKLNAEKHLIASRSHVLEGRS